MYSIFNLFECGTEIKLSTVCLFMTLPRRVGGVEVSLGLYILKGILAAISYPGSARAFTTSYHKEKKLL